MFIKFLKLYWPGVFFTVFVAGLLLTPVIFLPELGVMGWFFVLIAILIMVVPLEHFKDWRKKELAINEPKPDTASTLPKAGEIYDFPVQPHPAKMRIKRVFGDLETVLQVDVLINLPPKAKFVSLQRFMTGSMSMNRSPFLVIFEKDGKFSTWTWDWEDWEVFPIGDDFWAIEVDEIEVQEIE